MSRQYEWKALRAGKYQAVEVVGFAYAPKSSVLAGQLLTHFIDAYDNEEEARTAHPDCIEGFTSKFTAPHTSFDHLPSEDDPVPGGMYPDDYD